MNERPEKWEEQIRQGLDRLADLGDEQPPELANLQMLVADVQRDQRRQTVRDLALFWLCAVALLTGGLYAVSRQPVYFLALQGLVLLAVGVVWLGGRRRVTE
ncbi:MAG TPA: YxlC family protein [Symbiobacteriaceae bacterium]|nr:YxlC family protein [Symbiobacteriaceae bacterium]